MSRVKVYVACDQAIKALNRLNVEEFGKLKMADWDEINIIRTVVSLYRSSARKARKRYYEVAFEAYLLAMAMLGEEPKKAHEMAEKSISKEWVDGVLSEVDPVTQYCWDNEWERKAYRLAEVLEVTPDRNKEIDKALRYWSQQTGQYAVNCTDYAMIQAFQDAGVEEVEWVTETDEKTCSECDGRDGKRYKLDEIPIKHYGCRCTVEPVKV